ncbi:MAG: GTP-binding protein [Alphaproteobacteria bacterium]|nr:GTP-binding protein [Alphaproteobacteria bacterium]
MSQVPVTVLTGYLGAGKTTLLNRILTERHGKRYAVIINEFGAEGIDGDLVVNADEEIFETNNGCLCCTVRGDLIRILGSLMKRKDRFDAILVETTGLAAPAPVAQTFFVDAEVRARTRLDSITTVVDAKYIQQRLDDTSEAAEQIAFADMILLNKTDLVSAEELAAVERRIRGINPYAILHRTSRCDVPLDRVLGQGAFDLERILAQEPEFLAVDDHDHHHDHHGDHDHGHPAPLRHYHDEQIGSLSLRSERPLDRERLQRWLQELLATSGKDILRSKGIVSFRGDDRRFVFHAVHMTMDGDFMAPWPDGAPRVTRLVFIGRDLDEAAIRRGFEACVAA